MKGTLYTILQNRQKIVEATIARYISVLQRPQSRDVTIPDRPRAVAAHGHCFQKGCVNQMRMTDIDTKPTPASRECAALVYVTDAEAEDVVALEDGSDTEDVVVLVGAEVEDVVAFASGSEIGAVVELSLDAAAEAVVVADVEVVLGGSVCNSGHVVCFSPPNPPPLPPLPPRHTLTELPAPELLLRML